MLSRLTGLFRGSPLLLRNLVLYQTDEQIRKRVGGDAGVLKKFAKQVQPVVMSAIRHRSAEEFACIVAWDATRMFIFADAKESEVKADLLSAEAKIRAIVAPIVTGPVMFALVMAYGDAPQRYRPNPTPPEWQQMANRQKRPLPVPDMLFVA
jgi:hypothetical protein